MPPDALRMLTDLALAVTLIATGLGIGATSVGDPRSWMSDRRWLTVLVALNVVAFPLAAALLARLFGLDPDATTGVVLVAACSGGLIALVTVRIAGGDLPRALAAVVLLELLDLVSVPLWSLVLLSSAAAVPVGEVLRTLLLLLLLPLAAGWLVRRSRPRLATRLAWLARPVSSVGLATVIVGVLGEHGGLLVDALGSGVPVVGLVLLAGGMAAGWLLGGPSERGRRSMALVTAGHSSALALAVARSAFADRPVAEVAVVVLGLMGLVVPVLAAVALRSRAGRSVTAAGTLAEG